MKIENLIGELKKSGVDLPSLDVGKLLTYARLLKEWNEKINLTSIVEEEDVIEKHFFDSLLPCALTSFEGKKIIDIGSGAGFPGAIIALAYPSAQVTLVDATRKKFLFLEEVKETLQIPNLSFHVGRIEEMKSKRGSFDLASSRGFASASIFLEVATPMVKVGGEVIVMKGAKGKEELKEAGRAMEILGLRFGKHLEASLPTQGDIRHNFLLFKTKECADKYPREWAKIIKHPL